MMIVNNHKHHILCYHLGWSSNLHPWWERLLSYTACKISMRIIFYWQDNDDWFCLFTWAKCCVSINSRKNRSICFYLLNSMYICCRKIIPWWSSVFFFSVLFKKNKKLALHAVHCVRVQILNSYCYCTIIAGVWW